MTYCCSCWSHVNVWKHVRCCHGWKRTITALFPHLDPVLDCQTLFNLKCSGSITEETDFRPGDSQCMLGKTPIPLVKKNQQWLNNMYYCLLSLDGNTSVFHIILIICLKHRKKLLLIYFQKFFFFSGSMLWYLDGVPCCTLACLPTLTSIHSSKNRSRKVVELWRSSERGYFQAPPPSGICSEQQGS